MTLDSHEFFLILPEIFVASMASLILVLDRTRLSKFSMLLAMIGASAVVLLLGWLLSDIPLPTATAAVVAVISALASAFVLLHRTVFRQANVTQRDQGTGSDQSV